MWQQTYAPIAGSLGISALVAALPVFALLYALGVRRIPAWKSSLIGLGAAILVALFVYRMPAGLMISSVGYGAAFGLFPIGWIIFWAIVLYRVTVDTGKFEIIKNSVGSLTDDKRLQALLIAFAFGAFIEGASGFGTPVAVAAAMMAGLGFTPFYAAGICLLANTCPVAFGAIGIPIVTLAGITGLPLKALSADVGRICAPVSFFVPSYLILVMGGWRALKGVLPGAIVCGGAFAITQFTVSNFFSVYVTDILSSLTAILCLVILLRVWKPSDVMQNGAAPTVNRHTAGEIIYAWSPYVLLVIFVSLWGFDAVKVWLNKATWNLNWVGLHNLVLRVPPAVGKPTPYAAVFTLNLLSAAGTSCLFAAFGSALILGMPIVQFVKIVGSTARQLLFAMITLAAVLALAFLMNYCGATATLGLAFAATGVLFPFFSSLLGWLGVFLTGSDTSANALFGNLQVVTANSLHLKPVLMAASNSAGGVMGKMISLQSIAVAAAATGMPANDEARLFRFTLRHSVFLATVVGLVVVFYSYVMPAWAN
ncbi:MAG TPA: lactate permease LctP family transporter [Bryobacteraceae bacterium]|nr:lactate permease LctP family transporter [Bryobacteraceae bacterium]